MNRPNLSDTPSFPNRLEPVFWLLTFALLGIGVAMAFFWAPVEQTMGAVQKIFYLHLPVAINAFLACMVVFIASIGFLWQRSMWWDHLAASAAKVAVLLCGLVLLTGSIWGHSAWGQWWQWTPRLTFSLVLFLLYVVYLVIRPSIQSTQRRALVSAVYGLVAFLDVPLVYFSVKLMPDLHPRSIQLADVSMQVTLAFWFLPVTLLTVGLIAAGTRLQAGQAAVEDARHDSMPSVVAAPTTGGAV